MAVCFHSIIWDTMALFSAGDDETLRIWDLNEKAKPHVIQDRLQRWGQVTCLKWISAGSSENGELICFGTGRGLVILYQWSKDLVSKIRAFQIVVLTSDVV